MNLGEQQRMHGVLTIEVVDASGAIVETRRVPNLITTAGKKLMADILMGKRPAPSAWAIAVGTGKPKTPEQTQAVATAPQASNTALEGEVAEANATCIVDVENEVVSATVKGSLTALLPSESEQALVEAGILMKVGTETNRTLFNRVTFSQVTRGQMMHLNLSWKISF